MSVRGAAAGMHVPGVRAASIRVALMATAVVAVAYLVICVAVFAIVTTNLTGQIDARLTDTISRLTGGPGGGSGGHGGFEPGPRPDAPFGAPIIVWTVFPDGTIFSSEADAVLPTAYWSTVGPTTVNITTSSATFPVRVVGTPVGNAWVVVGQTMDAVSQAQATLLIAELAIAPALLLVIFLGAVAIGRRVAAPIERARQRQLEFTADASHELRTPLSVIEAQTSLALSQDREAAWYRNAFVRVQGESKRIRRLVEDMLWLARFDSLTTHPAAEPVDLGLMAAQAVDRFHAVAESRHLALQSRAEPGTNVVSVPAEWLDRLLGVLLDNACKYSPDGGAVRVAVAGDGNRVRLTVDDSGPGIPVGERERIFDRFHRATDQPGGSGLGLAIADAIVRATGGRWRIGESSTGGASMSVTWARSFTASREGTESTRSATAPRPS